MNKYNNDFYKDKGLTDKNRISIGIYNYQRSRFSFVLASYNTSIIMNKSEVLYLLIRPIPKKKIRGKNW